MARFQRGSLRIESRKNGQNWVLRYYVTRMSDGRRVEHKRSVLCMTAQPNRRHGRKWSASIYNSTDQISKPA